MSQKFERIGSDSFQIPVAERALKYASNQVSTNHLYVCAPRIKSFSRLLNNDMIRLSSNKNSSCCTGLTRQRRLISYALKQKSATVVQSVPKPKEGVQDLRKRGEEQPKSMQGAQF